MVPFVLFYLSQYLNMNRKAKTAPKRKAIYLA
jgi:hypothetical protein